MHWSSTGGGFSVLVANTCRECAKCRRFKSSSSESQKIITKDCGTEAARAARSAKFVVFGEFGYMYGGEERSNESNRNREE